MLCSCWCLSPLLFRLRSLRTSQPPIHARLPLHPPPPGRCPCFLLQEASCPSRSGPYSASGEWLRCQSVRGAFLFSAHGFYCIYLQTLNFHGDGGHTYTPRAQRRAISPPRDLRLGSVIVKGLDAQCAEHSSSLPSLC